MLSQAFSKSLRTLSLPRGSNRRIELVPFERSTRPEEKVEGVKVDVLGDGVRVDVLRLDVF